VGGELTRRDWLRDAKALLKDAGWWGEQRLIGPDGGERVTVFNPRRLELVYDVNTRMAYAAGRWERIQAAKQSHPFLRYVTRADERVRASHRAWHNVTLPVDDPWWNTHYPPNGWRCRCTAVQLRARDVEGNPNLKRQAPDEPLVEWKNPRTGEVVQVPANIDPGFAYNVGDAAMRLGGLDATVRTKLAQWPPSVAAAVRSTGVRIASNEELSAWIDQALGGHPVQPIAISPVMLAVQREIERLTGAAPRERVLLLRADPVRHIDNRHGADGEQTGDQKPIEASDYAMLARMVSAGQVELSKAVPERSGSGALRVVLRFVDGGWAYTVVAEVGRHALWPYTLYARPAR
jgi:SPP1 gp7 family putative phage head morphogenesis protein